MKFFHRFRLRFRRIPSSRERCSRAKGITNNQDLARPSCLEESWPSRCMEGHRYLRCRRIVWRQASLQNLAREHFLRSAIDSRGKSIFYWKVRFDTVRTVNTTTDRSEAWCVCRISQSTVRFIVDYPNDLFQNCPLGMDRIREDS